MRNVRHLKSEMVDPPRQGSRKVGAHNDSMLCELQLSQRHSRLCLTCATPDLGLEVGNRP